MNKFDLLRCVSQLNSLMMNVQFRVQFIWFHTGNFCFAKK